MAARRLWAGLQLLDRQLVDDDGVPCGIVDDLELARDEESGNLHVVAILSGPGALATRLGAPRLGGWLRRMNALVSTQEGDPVRIPFQRVRDVGGHVSLSLEASETGPATRERWARDHLIAHIPGSGHEVE